jgi:hypothetical protein
MSIFKIITGNYPIDGSTEVEPSQSSSQVLSSTLQFIQHNLGQVLTISGIEVARKGSKADEDNNLIYSDSRDFDRGISAGAFNSVFLTMAPDIPEAHVIATIRNAAKSATGVLVPKSAKAAISRACKDGKPGEFLRTNRQFLTFQKQDYKGYTISMKQRRFSVDFAEFENAFETHNDIVVSDTTLDNMFYAGLIAAYRSNYEIDRAARFATAIASIHRFTGLNPTTQEPDIDYSKLASILTD